MSQVLVLLRQTIFSQKSWKVVVKFISSIQQSFTAHIFIIKFTVENPFLSWQHRRTLSSTFPPNSSMSYKAGALDQRYVKHECAGCAFGGISVSIQRQSLRYETLQQTVNVTRRGQFVKKKRKKEISNHCVEWKALKTHECWLLFYPGKFWYPHVQFQLQRFKSFLSPYT